MKEQSIFSFLIETFMVVFSVLFRIIIGGVILSYLTIHNLFYPDNIIQYLTLLFGFLSYVLLPLYYYCINKWWETK